MGCNSDYLNPTHAEKDSKTAAQLLEYTFRALDKRNELPDYVTVAAANAYGNAAKLNDMVVLLCSTIRGMTDDQLNEIVYDGRSQMARRLADWWDEHKAADAKRIARETESENLVKLALNKLTQQEIAALKNHFTKK